MTREALLFYLRVALKRTHFTSMLQDDARNRLALEIFERIVEQEPHFDN